MYHVKKCSLKDGDLFSEVKLWNETEFVFLDNIMGETPQFIPETKAALMYDSENLYGRFTVRDKFVIAKATQNMEHVWKDSCVELFFTPSDKVAEGYFNLEMNCTGVIYMQHQISRGEGRISIPEENLRSVITRTTLTEPIPKEIKTETEWELVFKFPFELMKRFHPGFILPEPGVIWSGNFNKCADESSNPHWITWNKIELPKPEFHRPDFFGKFIFD